MKPQSVYTEEVQKILDYLEDHPLGDLEVSEGDTEEDVLAELEALQK